MPISGRLRVASVQANTSTAEIVQSCDYIQRGDIAPAVHPATRAPVQTRSEIRSVRATQRQGQGHDRQHDFALASAAGAGNIVYVNLGAKQGVQVGSYFRIFRYQDGHARCGL